jgi:hypothetical protein
MPNGKITEHITSRNLTESQSWRANIVNRFLDMGYQPTEEEVQALVPAAKGVGGFEAGASAVANYVQAMRQLGPAQDFIKGNLLSEQEASKMYDDLSKVQLQGGDEAYQKAADLYSQAPKLFGSMTADQIQAYIAPVTQATKETLGQIEGGAARRGLAGSSLEAQALAEQQRLYQQNVLSQGLGVGLDQQQRQAAILQALGGAKYGLSGTFGQLGTQNRNLANASAGQYAALAGEIGGLSGQAANNALLQNAFLQAMNPEKASFAGKLGSNFENIGLSSITNLGYNLLPGIAKPGGGLGLTPGSDSGANFLQQNPFLAQKLSALLGGGGAPGPLGGAVVPPVNPTGGLQTDSLGALAGMA